MSNVVGVLENLTFHPTTLKKLALMFDQIAIPGGWEMLDSYEEIWPQFDYREQRLLFQLGVLLDPYADPDQPQYDYDDEKLSAAISEITNEFKAAEKIKSMVANKHSLQRKLSLVLRHRFHLDAYPVAPSFSHLEFSSGTTDIACITLKQIPTPHYSTSWRQIFEFRKDPDSRHKFLDLRNWMSEVSHSNLTKIEIEQKLEYLISRYQRHMALHKMKVSSDTLETIVISSAEVLEGLAHLNFSRVAKALFLVKHRKIALTEAELTSPGNEIAYIVKAQDKFG